MDMNVRRLSVLAAIVLVALLVAIYDIETYTPPPHPLSIRREHPTPGDIEIFYMGKTVVSTLNVALLIFLLAMYTDLYRKVKSEFTVALMVFSVVLLLYALAANPIVYRSFGFGAFGLGPFAILPDIFTCIAVSILIYLSFRY